MIWNPFPAAWRKQRPSPRGRKSSSITFVEVRQLLCSPIFLSAFGRISVLADHVLEDFLVLVEGLASLQRVIDRHLVFEEDRIDRLLFRGDRSSSCMDTKMFMDSGMLPWGVPLFSSLFEARPPLDLQRARCPGCCRSGSFSLLLLTHSGWGGERSSSHSRILQLVLQLAHRRDTPWCRCRVHLVVIEQDPTIGLCHSSSRR